MKMTIDIEKLTRDQVYASSIGISEKVFTELVGKAVMVASSKLSMFRKENEYVDIEGAIGFEIADHAAAMENRNTNRRTA